MSGGHWNYQQYQVSAAAEDVRQIVATNDDERRDAWDVSRGRQYPPEVLREFRVGALLMDLAHIYWHRMDWLLSGDDGEETFLSRLREDLQTRATMMDDTTRDAWAQSLAATCVPDTATTVADTALQDAAPDLLAACRAWRAWAQHSTDGLRDLKTHTDLHSPSARAAHTAWYQTQTRLYDHATLLTAQAITRATMRPVTPVDDAMEALVIDAEQCARQELNGIPSE